MASRNEERRWCRAWRKGTANIFVRDGQLKALKNISICYLQSADIPRVSTSRIRSSDRLVETNRKGIGKQEASWNRGLEIPYNKSRGLMGLNGELTPSVSFKYKKCSGFIIKLTDKFNFSCSVWFSSFFYSSSDSLTSRNQTVYVSVFIFQWLFFSASVTIEMRSQWSWMVLYCVYCKQVARALTAI